VLKDRKADPGGPARYINGKSASSATSRDFINAALAGAILQPNLKTYKTMGLNTSFKVRKLWVPSTWFWGWVTGGLGGIGKRRLGFYRQTRGRPGIDRIL
jgi:hypothetical protein